ncbi:DUF481 domain-containing protein [Aureibacter tunicatorum]|uniref:DUF481 domain-containing protein n=1 Tax=Aureibacter tunicatorum TaxID=866807 RepID=A0AAE4BT90_9BACT|nr:DUF481 domain-containing protein [Aureibacter tunicatorum]MDR6239307.1 hypothetical protein [Aureibacter tunicatorum]BDD04769.1 hypothetical protein AUTU_22520 [Aureibacter tunicatorum]
MKKIILTTVSLICSINFLFANDPLTTSGKIAVLGNWQTGNLNQIGIKPKGSFNISNDIFSYSLSADYHYQHVEGHTVLNDLWVNNLLKINPNADIFPVAVINYGFAFSYQINHALISGVGLGGNILKKSKNKYIEISAHAGYMDFEFKNESSHQALALGSLINSSYPISKLLNLVWQFKTYHSLKEQAYWGTNNTITISTKLSSKVRINISHNLLYNAKTVEGIEKHNTQTLLGIEYKLK